MSQHSNRFKGEYKHFCIFRRNWIFCINTIDLTLESVFFFISKFKQITFTLELGSCGSSNRTHVTGPGQSMSIRACHKTKSSVGKKGILNLFGWKNYFGPQKIASKGYHQKLTNGLVSFFLSPLGKNWTDFNKTFHFISKYVTIFFVSGRISPKISTFNF